MFFTFNQGLDRKFCHHVSWIPGLATLPVKASTVFFPEIYLGNIWAEKAKNCDPSPASFLAMTAQLPLSSARALLKRSSKVSSSTFTHLMRLSILTGTPSLYQVNSGLPETLAVMTQGSSMAVFWSPIRSLKTGAPTMTSLPSVLASPRSLTRIASYLPSSSGST